MKKLIFRLLILAIPFIIIFTVISCFNTSNMLLSGFEDITTRPVLTSLKEIDNNLDAEVILVGDSRMDQINSPAYEQEITDRLGMKTINIAFGGASVEESLDLIDYAAEKLDLKQIYFEVSFYNIRNTGKQSRIAGEIDVYKNPLKMLLEYNSLTDSFTNLYYLVFPKKAVVGTGERDRHADFVEYPKTIYRNCKNFSIKEGLIERLVKLSEDCAKKGTEVIFVTPPFHKSIYESVIVPLNLEPIIESYTTAINKYATVHNLEWYNEFSCVDDNFADGIHVSLNKCEDFIDAAIFGNGIYVKVLPQTNN